MAKKKNITAEKIITWYMNTILLSGKPTSVLAFANDNNFEEADFYNHFSSFKSLEKAIFKVFANETLAMLHKTEAYQTYTAKEKLLGFYFTFFELLTVNRSYVTNRLENIGMNLEKLSVLTSLREVFLEFIKSIGIETLDLKNERANKFQDKGIAEAYWLQFMTILKFWLSDESPNFEKTDLYIEKSVKASFDIQQIAPLKSVIDLAKFLWKEKNTMT